MSRSGWAKDWHLRKRWSGHMGVEDNGSPLLHACSTTERALQHTEHRLDYHHHHGHHGPQGEHSAGCLGRVWSGLVWSGLVWFGLVWFGLVWSGLVRFWSGLVRVWSGLVWWESGLVWSGLMRVWSGLVRVWSGELRKGVEVDWCEDEQRQLSSWVSSLHGLNIETSSVSRLYPNW